MLDGSVGRLPNAMSMQKIRNPKEHIYRNKGVFHHVLLEEGW